MILTLTLNPAVDVSLTTDRIIYDDRTYITSESYQPGGKGINVARTLQGYGAEVEAIATQGGPMGERFARLLEQVGLAATLIPVRGETRRNVAVIDEEGLTLKLDQRGAPLTAEELGRIEAVVAEKLPRARWLTLNGSIPPGTPQDLYPRLIRLAQEHGVRTLLDTSGPALESGLAARPTLAKPNRPEAERLLGRTLFGESDALEGALEILAMGPEHVALSLGGQGAVGVSGRDRLRATPPVVQNGSPIGAGDVMAATIVWKLWQGEEFAEAFVWGVAAATVAAGRPGLGAGDPAEVASMRKKIQVREL
ncbi:MAG: hexose kinase [Acidobacteria bacterium]|nr:hexose kinase [Acidobacteriota bacterium]